MKHIVITTSIILGLALTGCGEETVTIRGKEYPVTVKVIDGKEYKYANNRLFEEYCPNGEPRWLITIGNPKKCTDNNTKKKTDIILGNGEDFSFSNDDDKK